MCYVGIIAVNYEVIGGSLILSAVNVFHQKFQCMSRWTVYNLAETYRIVVVLLDNRTPMANPVSFV